MSSESENNGNNGRIHVKVVTTARDLNEHYSREEPLRTVFNAALALVGGEGHPEQFVLEYNDQPLSDLDRTLGDLADELGWGKKVELELVPNPVVV